jgi:hypothetical protein
MARKYSSDEVYALLGSAIVHDLVKSQLLDLIGERIRLKAMDDCVPMEAVNTKRLLDSTAICIDGVLFYLSDNMKFVEASAITFTYK